MTTRRLLFLTYSQSLLLSKRDLGLIFLQALGLDSMSQPNRLILQQHVLQLGVSGYG